MFDTDIDQAVRSSTVISPTRINLGGSHFVPKRDYETR